MERELYREVCAELARLPIAFDPHQTYDDRRVVEVFLWAALHERPTGWGCRPSSWPIDLRRRPLPSQSRMSRRLRTPAVRGLLELLYRAFRDRLPRSFIKHIDAKPLPVGGASKDRDARFGRGAGSVVSGYKILTVTDASGAIDCWTLAPMNVAEHDAARELVAAMPWALFLVGDNAYDKNGLYEAAAARMVHLVGAFKKNAKGLGHREHAPQRVASFELQKTPEGRWLVEGRRAIERSYGNLTGFAGGLGPLPAWVRTPTRVSAWVGAKLILDAARRVRLRESRVTDAAA